LRRSSSEIVIPYRWEILRRVSPNRTTAEGVTGSGGEGRERRELVDGSSAIREASLPTEDDPSSGSGEGAGRLSRAVVMLGFGSTAWGSCGTSRGPEAESTNGSGSLGSPRTVGLLAIALTSGNAAGATRSRGRMDLKGFMQCFTHWTKSRGEADIHVTGRQ
jgi:hypothetical protein